MELFANLFRLDLFSHLGEWVVGYGLILARVLGFVHQAPVFKHKSISGLSRIGVAILLSMILLDVVPSPEIPSEGYFYPTAIILNTILGLIMGFVANLMFVTVTAGGEMMDSAMGFSSGQMFDPTVGGQTTIMGRFLTTLSLVVFFAISGPELLIKGLYASFMAFDLYQPNIAMDIDRLIKLTGDIITMGFIIVSPIVLTILVNDLVLGLVSRTAPQINAFQISFTIKPTIGEIIFILTLPLYFSSLVNLFSSSSRYF